MKENIADTGVKTMLFTNRDGAIGAPHRFGVEAETRQCHNPTDACPDDRERMATLQGDRYALFRDRESASEIAQVSRSHLYKTAGDDAQLRTAPETPLS